MSDYHPPQQTVSGRILTSAGWLEGSLHLAKLHSLAEYLSHHAWYPMTDVVLARVGTMPFFALRRDETLLVSTHQPPPKESLPASATQTRVTLLFPGGAVDGLVAVPPGLRLFDFVTRTTSFVQVAEANVHVWADTSAVFLGHLLVNPGRLVGVTEVELPR